MMRTRNRPGRQKRSPRDLERRLRESTSRLRQVDQELESFTYSASHDLRAPLRKIESFIQLGLERLSRGDEKTGLEYLRRAQEAARQAHRLIDDMQRLASITQSALAPGNIDLSGLVDDVVAEVRSRCGERAVEFRVEPGLKACADAGVLRAALLSLMDNACKFTRCRARGVVEFAAGPPGTFLVRDNGEGFDMALVHKIFQPFERLHRPEEYPGTGMGLAIARRAIERHGGRLWAESAPGRGATFYFTLGNPAQ